MPNQPLATMIEVIYSNPFLLLHLNDLFWIERYRYVQSIVYMRLTIVKPHGLVILAFVVGLAILSISSMSSAGVITYATSNFTSFMLNESHITNRRAFLSNLVISFIN